MSESRRFFEFLAAAFCGGILGKLFEIYFSTTDLIQQLVLLCIMFVIVILVYLCLVFPFREKSKKK